MSLNVNDKGGNFELVPEDTHHAVCYGVYDIGTHLNPMYGNSQHQIVITWELPDCLLEDGRPMSISKFYTASLNEKANLRKDLQSWRGRAFTQEELEGFHLGKLIGANCQLQVIHKDSSGTKKAVVNAVMAMLKNMEHKKPTNPTVIFEIEYDENNIPMIPDFPESMPEWIQKKIKESQEWADAHNYSKQDSKQESPEFNHDTEPF